MLHATVDSKQLVFLKLNKDLTAIPLFKALFLAVLSLFIYNLCQSEIKSPQRAFRALDYKTWTINNIFLSFLRNVSVQGIIQILFNFVGFIEKNFKQLLNINLPGISKHFIN